MSPWLTLPDGHVVPAGSQLPGQLALWPPHTGRDDCPACRLLTCDRTATR